MAACEERTSSPVTICLSRNLGEALFLARQRTQCDQSLATSVLPCFNLFPFRKWFLVIECGRGCKGGHSPSWPTCSGCALLLQHDQHVNLSGRRTAPVVKIQVPLGGSAVRGSVVIYDVGDWSDRKRLNCKLCLVRFF